MIIFLAGLQAIPEELKEAAAIDGAGKWRTFRSITLPLLKPTLLLGAVLAGCLPRSGSEPPVAESHRAALVNGAGCATHADCDSGICEDGLCCAVWLPLPTATSRPFLADDREGRPRQSEGRGPTRGVWWWWWSGRLPHC